MRRGFKCRKNVLEKLKQEYDNIVFKVYKENPAVALENFEKIAENDLRKLLSKYYSNERSLNQAWKTCKGSLYEYAVFRHIQKVIDEDEYLKNKIKIMMGDDAIEAHKEEIVIRNWSDIFPDVDLLLIEKETNKILAILSCKTSLRERLTETAFWKREMEKTRGKEGIKLVFITTDKDRELRTDTNRYILLHVVDYTFITDPERYAELIEAYRKKYGKKEDFEDFIGKIKPVDAIKQFIYTLLREK